MAAPFGEALRPEFVAPLATFLASAECHRERRSLFRPRRPLCPRRHRVTPGWLGPRDAPATAEDIRAHLAEIADPAGLAIPEAPADEYRLIAERIARGEG